MKKITNVSPDNIRILIKDGVSFDLYPQSFIFSNEPNLSATIRVYAKKKLLRVEDIDKPGHLETLRIYSKIDETSIASLMESQASIILKEDEEESELSEEDFQKMVDNIIDDLENAPEEDFDLDNVGVLSEDGHELSITVVDEEEILKECEEKCQAIIDGEIIKAVKGEPNDLLPQEEKKDLAKVIEEATHVFISADLVPQEDKTVSVREGILQKAQTEVKEYLEDNEAPKPKNKGGRPKGSKNKPKVSKRGRPKKRGPKKGSKNKKK